MQSLNLGDVIKVIAPDDQAKILKVVGVEPIYPFTVNVIPSLISGINAGVISSATSRIQQLETDPDELWELYVYLDQPLLYGFGLGGQSATYDSIFKNMAKLYAGPGFGAYDKLRLSPFAAPTTTTTEYQLYLRTQQTPYANTQIPQDFAVQIERISLYNSGSSAASLTIYDSYTSGNVALTTYQLAASGSIIDTPNIEIRGSLAVSASASGVNVNDLVLRFKPLLTVLKDNVDYVNEVLNTSYIKFFIGLSNHYYITLGNIHNFALPGNTIQTVNLRIFGYRYFVGELAKPSVPPTKIVTMNIPDTVAVQTLANLV